MDYEIREVAEQPDELAHHGILGQRWGIRRFQTKDGSLTPAGRKRYGSVSEGFKKVGEIAKSKWKKANDSFDEAQRKKKEVAEERRMNEHTRLVEKGSPKEIKKHIREFTSDELSSIEKRFATEISVQNKIESILGSNKATKPVQVISQRQKSDVGESIKKGTQTVSTIINNTRTSVENATKFWNNIVEIHNTFKPSGSRNWRTITTGGGGSP